MRELSLSFALCLLLLGPVLASDDYYDDDDPVIPYAVLEEAQAAEEAAEAPVDGEAVDWGFAYNRGAFFGAGDPEKAYGQLSYDRSALTHFTRNIDSEDYRDFSAAFFSGLDYQSLDTDQIYGPLWGVPGNAVGMEGYASLTLEQLAAQREFLPPELQAWLAAHEVEAEDAEDDGDGEGEESSEHQGGLDLATDDWG